MESHSHIRRWAALAACLVLVTLGTVAGVIVTQDDTGGRVAQPKARNALASYPVDVDNKRALVGWADNVFLGKVTAIKGTGTIPDTTPDAPDWPYTLYEVSVLVNVKGKLEQTVVIRQDTGVDTDGFTCTYEGDHSLVVGSEYLFVTKGPATAAEEVDSQQVAPGCPRLINKYGDIVVTDSASRGRLIREFQDAVAREIPFQM